MIEARDLCRRYGDFTAVEDISFAVEEGEILGILGPNGAGKTTTIRMITGFLPPTSGQVTLSGHDLHQDPARARRLLGYLPENVALYPEMRVREYLAYRARLEGLTRGRSAAALDAALEHCLLTGAKNQIIGTLSKGFRQRVGLAAAILHDPEVLVLDEPTVGLDPKQIIAIRELIRELGKSRTLLLSTHILPEVELLCDRILIIDRGRIVDQGRPRDLQRRWDSGTTITVTVKDAPPEAAGTLATLPGVRFCRLEREEVPGRFVLECDRPRGDQASDPREAVFRLAVERGWVLLELAEQSASLEEIFVRLTTREGEAVSEAEVLPDVTPAQKEELPS